MGFTVSIIDCSPEIKIKSATASPSIPSMLILNTNAIPMPKSTAPVAILSLKLSCAVALSAGDEISFEIPL